MVADGVGTRRGSQTGLARLQGGKQLREVVDRNVGS